MSKRFRIVGLCLVAVFAVSAAGAASASAAPEWFKCEEVASGNFINAGCTEAGAGKFESKKLAAKLAVESKGRLKLTAAGVTLTCPKAAEAEGKDKGSVGPGSTDEITEITDSAGKTTIKCDTSSEFLCGKEATAEALHLPWITKLILSGTEIRDEIVSGTGGEPGYKTKCLGGLKTELTCTGKTSTKVINLISWNVALEFDAKSAKANCGGGIEGEIRGTDTVLHPAGTTSIFVK